MKTFLFENSKQQLPARQAKRPFTAGKCLGRSQDKKTKHDWSIILFATSEDSDTIRK